MYNMFYKFYSSIVNRFLTILLILEPVLKYINSVLQHLTDGLREDNRAKKLWCPNSEVEFAHGASLMEDTTMDTRDHKETNISYLGFPVQY